MAAYTFMYIPSAALMYSEVGAGHQGGVPVMDDMWRESLIARRSCPQRRTDTLSACGEISRCSQRQARPNGELLLLHYKSALASVNSYVRIVGHKLDLQLWLFYGCKQGRPPDYGYLCQISHTCLLYLCVLTLT